MSLASTAERLTLPLDWCRRLWLSWLTRSEWLLHTLRHPDRRIAILASTNVAVAAVGAVYFPVFLFTLGPVLLGVAHVAADVRYLVLRQNLARWWQNTVWVGCLALFLLRVCESLGLLRQPERIELGAASLFCAVALFAALRERGSVERAMLAAVLLAAVTALALAHPATARLIFLHAHNLVALVAWATLFRRGRRARFVPLLLIGGVACALATGAFYEQTLHSSFASSFGLHVLAVSRWVAPFQTARFAIGATTTYLFLQSVHYAAWLGWIPHEEQPARGTPTFRMSARSLFADLGAPGVAAVIIAALAVLIGACVQLGRARALYLSLATFHGYLELALLTYFWVRATHPRGRGPRCAE